MLSFHNSQELKDRLALITYRARWNEKAREQMGQISGSIEYGLPKKLTVLSYWVCDMLDGFEWSNFASEFYEQIPVGKDLTLVPLQFIRNILAPESLVMPNAYKSETVYYFECRQKIKEAFLEIAKIYQDVLDGHYREESLEARQKALDSFIKLGGIKAYLAQFEGDPMCEIGICAIDILESFDAEENGSDYREHCEKLLNNCAYIWEQFGVKNSSLWFRNLLFRLVR